MRKLISIFSLSSILLLPIPAMADCTEKACVDVYVKDGKIVIDGKKSGATSISTPKPKVTPKNSVKPRAKISIAPKPKVTLTSKPIPKPSIKRTVKPRSNASRKPSKSSSPSLADQVLQSLPTLQVAYQPEGVALTGVPVVFFTDLPTQFNKSYKVVGVDVAINVKPKSLWEFGDGAVLLTNKPGKPYPSKEITHTYYVPGTYPVVVATIWDGTFTVEGVTKPIGGVIRQVTAVDVKVVGAETKFVGK